MDEATATASDEVEAEDTTNLAQAAQLREDRAMLLEPACLTMARSRQQTKQDNHGRNSFNTLARMTDKAQVMKYKIN